MSDNINDRRLGPAPVCPDCGGPLGSEHNVYQCEGWADDDEPDEPVGSCDDCGANIMEFEDDGSGLCDRCQWYAAVAAGRIEP